MFFLNLLCSVVDTILLIKHQSYETLDHEGFIKIQEDTIWAIFLDLDCCSMALRGLSDCDRQNIC